MLSRVSAFCTRYPLARGMLSYALTWPTSCVLQDTLISGKSMSEVDWGRCVRFGLYGSLYVAPTLFVWVRMARTMWPKTSFKTSVIKALTETITYRPAASSSFFFFMTLMEGRSLGDACDEVRTKFLPTYKVGICYWPLVALVSFSIIPDRNRLPFISICSLIWACYLATMKEMHLANEGHKQ